MSATVKSFGEQLRKERERQGLTAGTVAHACRVSRSYISLIESGKRLPGKKNISKIAASLGVKTGVVLNWYLEDLTQKIRKHL